MPMFHTSGCGMITLNCLQAGYRMLLVEFFASLAVLDQVEISGADIILGVPTMNEPCFMSKKHVFATYQR